jgi:hypothetical protein
MRLAWGLHAALMLLTASVGAAERTAGSVPVTVANHSAPTVCAEDDNIYLTLSGPVQRFRIEARAPAVIGSIVVDSSAPDFTDCTIIDQPPEPGAEQFRVVLFEDERVVLVGWRKTGFWHKSDVPVLIGDREERQLQLVQLFLKTKTEPYEFVVLYPNDGYWRARPLPPERLKEVAYGTSFLLGPVEHAARPYVSYRSVRFDPQTHRFQLDFLRGGGAEVSIGKPSVASVPLTVSFSGPRPATRPFAALRSMFVTENNADAAEVAWKTPGAKAWSQAGVMAWRGGKVTELWLGRTAISKHNTSAPDMLIKDFFFNGFQSNDRR